MKSVDSLRWAAQAGMIGGLLRDSVFGVGGTPDHPVFRPYNAVVVVLAQLLIVSLAATSVLSEKAG